MTGEDKKELNNLICMLEMHHIDSTILFEIQNLIQSQQKEIEKKNKIIDLMSYAITHEEVPMDEYCVFRDISCEIVGGNKECKECIKQYFEKKVEGK